MSKGPLSEKSQIKLNKEKTKKIPKKYRTILKQLDIPRFDMKILKPEELEGTPDKPLGPKVPEWFDFQAMPTKSMDYRDKGIGVQYRGKPLDPVVILGTDDRRTYRANNIGYPWICVCRIVTSSGTGSGVIIGPRHVLTASHVVNWAVNSGRQGVVEVFRHGAMVAATSPVQSVFAFDRITGPTIGAAELDEDYAVLITQDRIGDVFGYYGTRTYSSSWDAEPYWWTVGYPGDVSGAQIPTFQRRKWLDEFSFDRGSARAMETNADVFPGQSGSPMFSFWQDGPYVVATISAEDRSDNENYCSGGRLLTRLVSRARSEFR